MDILNGRYRLVERIASDLLGVTWLAEDLEHEDKALRLRILSVDITESEYVRLLISRFVQMATLIHPNLMQAYEMDVIRRINNRTHPHLQYFYTTEHVPQSLGVNYLTLSQDEILEVVRQLCYALNYLHFRGYAYKYLNFHNVTILRTEEGIRVKLLDLPTIIHYRQQLDAFSDEVEQFLPPEIIRDTDSNPTSDIYSLGVMLYYLFGAVPYQECSFDRVMDEHPDQDIYMLIKIMTIKNATDRFTTVLEFVEALQVVFPMAFPFEDRDSYEKLIFTTPLIGRDKELGDTLDVIDRRLDLRSDVRQILIQGEPGIGKSRFLRELWFQTMMKRVPCCTITIPSKQTRGFLVFKTLLRHIFTEGAPAPDLIKKYGSELVKILPEIENRWKVLPSETLEEEAEQMRLSNRIYNFILEYAQTTPLAVFVDDCQFMSRQDFSILEYLMSTRRKLPLMFIGTLREESSPYFPALSAWVESGVCQTVQLNKLGFTEAVEFLQYILGVGFRPIALAARIMGEAAGVPRLIEESVKTLFMFEYLTVKEDRQWSDPSDKVLDMDFSLTTDEMPDYALEFFDSETLSILTALSIFDKPAPGNVLTEMLDLSMESIENGLEALVSGRILNRKLGDLGYTYDFLNKRLRKKVQSVLKSEEVVRLHGIAADYLERLNAQGNEIFTESLVYHLTSSGQLEKAAGQARNIAVQMEAMNQNRQALEFYSLAVKLLTDLGLREQLPALLIKLGDIHLKLNDSEKACRHFEDARIKARDIGQAEVEMDALVRFCSIRVAMKEMSTTEEDLRKAIAQCQAIGYFRGEVEAVLVLCRVMLSFGRFDEIRALVNQYLATVRGTGEDYYYGRLMNEKGICDLYTGRPSDAFSALLESDRCLEKSGNALERVRPLNNLGILNFDCLGDLDKSREYFNRVITLSERANVVWGLDMVYSNLAETYMKEDDYERALSYLNQSCRLAEDARNNDMLFYIYSNLCITYLSCCQYDEAYRYLSKLDYEFANRKGHALNTALFFLCHIRFALTVRQYDEALEWYRQANEGGTHIPDNLRFEFELLKLRIDHLSGEGNRPPDIVNHISALVKATANPVEIGLCRDLILDLATEAMSTQDNAQLQRLMAFDAELADQFDTTRLGIRRRLLKTVLAEDNWQEGLKALLNDSALPQHPTEHWLVNLMAGRLYDHGKDVYQAMVHYYSAMDLLRVMALRVPERFRNTFVLEDSLKVGLYRHLHGLARRILSGNRGEAQIIQLPADLHDFFIVTEEERLLSNQRFLNTVYRRYEKMLDIRIDSLYSLTDQYGSDEYQNILLTVKYMVQLTFADRGFFFFSREYGANEEPIATDPHAAVPDVSRFSAMLEFDSEGLLSRNRLDLKVGGPSRHASEAVMILPVRQEELEKVQSGRRRHEGRENGGKVAGYVYLQSDKPFNNFTEATFEACRILTRNLRILVENYYLKRTSVIDRLTSVSLRKHIESRLSEELERSKEDGRELSIIMADIDHFKNVNDIYGHQKGDEVLREIGRILRTNLRKGDLVGRYGGEEFILVLPDTGDIDAYKVCEKIRRCIETTVLLNDHSPLTMSFGAASHPAHGMVEEELIEKADQALYESKHMGRNRTTVWTPNIGVSKQRFDKLAGILEGNISADSRKVQSMVDIMSLINRPIGRDAKIYEILSLLVDICEAQDATLVRMEDGVIRERFTRSVGIDGLERHAVIPEDLILDTAERGYGTYLVDWANPCQDMAHAGAPDWLSYIAIPLLNEGAVSGVLILSVPISRHEFDFNGFNYVNTLSGVISVILN